MIYHDLLTRTQLIDADSDKCLLYTRILYTSIVGEQNDKC